MARYKLQGRARDTWGNTITGLDIYVYVSGTSRTQDAIVYTSSTSTTAISAAPQISSDTYGFFNFWVDDTDYTASTTKFDIFADGLEYTYIDIFNIKNHSILSGLPRNDHPQYTAASAAEVITGTWYFSTPASGATPSAGMHLVNKDYVDTVVASISAGEGLVESPANVLNVNPGNGIEITFDAVTVKQDELTHANISGLGADDHTQYSRVDGTRAFTGAVGGITPTADEHLVTKLYLESNYPSAAIPSAGGPIIVTNNWYFTVPVSGVSPSADNHLAIKQYVDNAVLSVSAGGGLIEPQPNVFAVNPDGTTIQIVSDEVAVIQGGLDHVNIQNIGTNTHAEIDSSLLSIEASAADLNTQILSVSAAVGEEFLRQDGTTPLEGNWDAGPYDILVGGDVHISGSLFTSGASIYTTAIHPLTSPSAAINITDGGPVELYYNGVKSVETYNKIGAGGGYGINLSDGKGLIYSNTAGTNMDIKSIGANNTGMSFYVNDSGGAEKLSMHLQHNGGIRFYNNDILTVALRSGGLYYKDATSTNSIYTSGTTFIVRGDTVGTNVLIDSKDLSGSYRNILHGDPDGSVELYNDGTKVFQTYKNASLEGFEIGDFTTPASASEISRMYQSGSQLTFKNDYHNGSILFQGESAAGATSRLLALKVAGSTLYNDDVAALLIQDGGFQAKAADGSNSLAIQAFNGGSLIRNQQTNGYIVLQANSSAAPFIKNILRGYANGTTELYYDGVKHFETNAGGILLQSGVAVNEISNDTTLTDASPSALVTEYAVKTFVLAASAARDEHNELKNIQGGIPSASEYYHLSESIHDGLFSASPTIGMGASASTRLEVDYGNDTITANSSGTGLISFDSNEFTVGYGGFPHLTVTADDTYLGRTNTDYIWVDDSGNSVSIYAIGSLTANFTNNAQAIGRNTEASISTWQGGLNQIRGTIGNAQRLYIDDTSFSIGASATGIVQVRDGAIQMHDGNELIMNAGSARQYFGRSDDAGTFMHFLTLAGDQSFMDFRIDNITMMNHNYTGSVFGNTGSDGTRLSITTPSGPGQSDAGNEVIIRVIGDRAVFNSSGMQLTGNLDTTGDLYVSGGDVFTSNIKELGTTQNAISIFGGTVSLYKDGNTRLTTAADGVSFIGGWTHFWNSTQTGQASTVHDGTNFRMFNAVHGGIIRIGSEDTGGTYRDGIYMDPDGSTTLYTSGAAVLQTNTDGITITGDTEPWIISSLSGGDMYFRNQNHGHGFRFDGENNAGANKAILAGDPDGAIDFYHAGLRSFYTRASGMYIVNAAGGNVSTGTILANADGNLYIDTVAPTASGIYLRGVGSDTFNDVLFHGVADGASELYYAGNKVAETTENGFTVTTSAGTDVAVFTDGSITITGTADISGRAAVGSTASINDSVGLWVGHDFDTTTAYGQYIGIDNAASGSTVDTNGLRILVQNDTSLEHRDLTGINVGVNPTADGVVVANLVGVDTQATCPADNSTITNMIGLRAEAATGFSMVNQTVTNMIAGSFQTLHSGSGDVSVTDGYGVRILAPGYTPTGTITNLYGLYIEDQSTTGFTNDYNLYSAGVSATNRLEGNLLVDGVIGVPSGTYIDIDSDPTGAYIDLYALDTTLSRDAQLTIDGSLKIVEIYCGGNRLLNANDDGINLGYAGNETNMSISSYDDQIEINSAGLQVVEILDDKMTWGPSGDTHIYFEYPGGNIELRPSDNLSLEVSPSGAVVHGKLEYLNISTVTGATTASNADVILASGGPYTVSLTEKDRSIIRVKYIGSGSTITVQGLSGTIDGAANTTLTSQYESKTLVSDGSDWYIV